MILVDANLLIYAKITSALQHATARDWLDRRLNGPVPVGIAWISLLAFLRVATNPRVSDRPVPMAEAWRQVQDWLACEPVWTPVPTERHQEILGKFLELPGVYGNLVPDAHLAALAVEHGLTLCSNDDDFARFPGLRWINPLQ